MQTLQLEFKSESERVDSQKFSDLHWCTCVDYTHHKEKSLVETVY